MKIENFTENFQSNAVYLRKKSGLIQQKLADCLDIKRSLVGAIEEGRCLGIENVYRYSVFFDVSMESLITTQLRA